MLKQLKPGDKTLFSELVRTQGELDEIEQTIDRVIDSELKKLKDDLAKAADKQNQMTAALKLFGKNAKNDRKAVFVFLPSRHERSQLAKLNHDGIVICRHHEAIQQFDASPHVG